MAYRQKGSPYYYASVPHPTSGRMVGKSTGAKTKREAEAIEAKWRVERREQQIWGAPKPLLLSQCLKQYLSATESKRSHREDKIRAVTLLERLGELSAYDLTTAKLQRYIQDRLESLTSSPA